MTDVRILLTPAAWADFVPVYLAVLLLLAYHAGGLLTERWAYKPRHRPTPRHSLKAGRVDVVLMCANLDDDQRARYGGARAD